MSYPISSLRAESTQLHRHSLFGASYKSHAEVAVSRRADVAAGDVISEDPRRRAPARGGFTEAETSEMAAGRPISVKLLRLPSGRPA